MFYIMVEDNNIIACGQCPCASEDIQSIEVLEETINFIKQQLPNNKIIYGGSINEKNIDTLQQLNNIDGYLLGGLSLHLDKLKLFLDKLK